MIAVHEIMTTDVHTLGPYETLGDAKRLLVEQGIRHVPILDGNQTLIGLVSDRDILAIEDSRLVSEKERRSPESVTISRFMTRELITVEPTAGIRRAARRLERLKIGCLPVVDKGRLVGIVTEADFVAVAINLVEIIEQFERSDDLPD